MLLRVLSTWVLKNRKISLLLISLYALFAVFFAFNAQLTFNAGKVLPVTDSAFVRYQKFKQTFGEDGRVMVLGVQSDKIFQKDFFNDWRSLSNKIKDIEGIEEVLSLGRMYALEKDTLNAKFTVRPLKGEANLSQNQVDSIKGIVQRNLFFRGLIYQPNTHTTLMAVTFRADVFNTPKRVPVIKEIERLSKEFSAKHHTELHISGLPYIRTEITNLVSREFSMFLGFSILVAMVVLWIFFRSFSVVGFSLLAVLLGVATSMATISLMGYKITLLTGLIPPIIVVIGLPNNILLVNKYHIEYKLLGNKIKALAMAMQRVGFTIFIANLTTAVGFGVLAFTGSELLTEFGLVASVNVMLTYLICLILVPLLFSFLPPPNLKQVKHLDSQWLKRLITKVEFLVCNKRKYVYWGTFILVLVSLWGISLINVNGYVVDDLPKGSRLLSDLRFFEKHFEGALPFEVSIDTKKKNGVLKASLVEKVDELETILSSYPELSKPVSLNTALKYATQVYYGGDTAFYRSPTSEELPFVASYFKQGGKKGNSLLKSFVDSNKRVTRISFQMVDVGSKRINQILEEVQPKIDSVFSPKRYQVDITGSSVVFVKGTNYLLDNLRDSLILAIVLISLIMWGLFRGFKMVFISLIPNVIPLMITAGLMGFMQINLKPSTILIFSIALGIASDQTIYFLTRYRYELKNTDWSVSKIVLDTINETGVSMIYTAIILFFGFGIFSVSTFGGTVALGILLAVTLILAVFFNLLLLPSVLLSIEKRNQENDKNEE